jgi:hypothetical protein
MVDLGHILSVKQRQLKASALHSSASWGRAAPLPVNSLAMDEKILARAVLKMPFSQGL